MKRIHLILLHHPYLFLRPLQRLIVGDVMGEEGEVQYPSGAARINARFQVAIELFLVMKCEEATGISLFNAAWKHY